MHNVVIAAHCADVLHDVLQQLGILVVDLHVRQRSWFQIAANGVGNLRQTRDDWIGVSLVPGEDHVLLQDGSRDVIVESNRGAAFVLLFDAAVVDESQHTALKAEVDSTIAVRNKQ